jgi:drug/metabolite transporter (DMT)-like permease
MVSATILWGGHFVLAHIVTAEMSPLSLTLMRLLIAAPALLVLAQVVERPNWRHVLRALPRLVPLALAGMIAYNLFLYQALRYTDSIGAAIVNAANPAMIALIAALAGYSRLGLRSVIGIVASLAGVLVVTTHGSLTSLLSLNLGLGQLLMLGAIVVWSIYTIWGRVPGVPPITAIAVQASVVVVVLAPTTLWTPLEFPTDTAGWWALLYIGLLPSVGSYVLWAIALKSTPAGVAGVFLNLITVSAVAISVALGSRLQPGDVVGAIIIFAGITLTTVASRRSTATPTRHRANAGDERDSAPHLERAHHTRHDQAHAPTIGIPTGLGHRPRGVASTRTQD